VERLVHEAKLAWAVAEAAKPYLSAVERDAVFVAIGAGETFAAIRQLFRSVEIKRIPLRPDLLHHCRTWLHGYLGHEDERYLRRLIEEPLIPYAITPRATIRATRMPATPTSATPSSMAPTQVGERPCCSSGRRSNEGNSYLSSRENGSANAASATGNIAAICALGRRVPHDQRHPHGPSHPGAFRLRDFPVGGMPMIAEPTFEVHADPSGEVLHTAPGYEDADNWRVRNHLAWVIVRHWRS
jgi:hypothetical protein